MLRITLFLLLGFCLASCEVKGPDSPARGARVSDPDHLYFKNVKTRRYGATEDESLHLTRYLHDGFLGDDHRIRLYLVDNWIHGRAFLELKHYDVEAGKEIDIRNLYTPRHLGRQILISQDRLADAESLKQLKKQLSGQEKLCYQLPEKGPELCLEVGTKSRIALLETVTDYLRLTQVDR